MRISTERTIEYILEDERDLHPNQQTVFRLKILTVPEAEEVENSLFFTKGRGKKTVNKLQLGTQRRMAIYKGLIGWRNLVNEKGEEVPFSKENIDFLVAEIRTELANKIMGESEISGEEEQD